ncbi:hypothetical protein Q7P37_007548 [Cladosporium fusiforme]
MRVKALKHWAMGANGLASKLGRETPTKLQVTERGMVFSKRKKFSILRKVWKPFSQASADAGRSRSQAIAADWKPIKGRRRSPFRKDHLLHSHHFVHQHLPLSPSKTSIVHSGNMHLPTLATFVLGLGGLVSADSGFFATCHNFSKLKGADRPVHFWGDCRMSGKGPWNVGATINLDSCFGNSGGRLVAQLNGGFSGSCRKFRRDGSWLNAECGDGKGGWPAASIDMNNHIGNYNGKMKCHGQTGIS